jgi:hypothetical protein
MSKTTNTRGFGCTCDYLAGCQLPQLTLSELPLSYATAMEEYSEDVYNAGRMDSFVNRMGYAVEQLFQNCSVIPLIPANDDETITEDASACTDVYDFVRFRGWYL